MKYKCLHDVLIDKELAFKRHCIYDVTTDGTIFGCNNKRFNFHDLPINNSVYFKTLEYNPLVAKNDAVNHPSHYTWLKDKVGIEVIDITRHLDFDLGNAIKYILRAGHKQDAIEDLQKAIWYLNDKIEVLKNEKQ